MEMVSRNNVHEVVASYKTRKIGESAMIEEEKQQLSTNSNQQQQQDGIDDLKWVNFYLVFQTRTNIFLKCRPGITKLARRVTNIPESRKSAFRIPYDQEQVALSIRRRLEGLPIPNKGLMRQELMMGVIGSVPKMVQLVSPGNNVVDLYVEVLVEHNHIFDVSDIVQCRLLVELESVPVGCIVECLDKLSKEEEVSLTAAASSSIKLSTASDDDDDQICPICLEQVLGEGNVISLPCKHPFHGTCIAKWLARSSHCPMCRYDIRYYFVSFG